MIRGMTIGQLAARTGISVRTLRFYADAGVLPVAGRSDSGYRLFGAEAVARARLVRTLRQLGVGLDDVKRVLGAEMSLADVATAHANALDAQIRALGLQRAVLRAVAKSTDPKELERMTDLTTLTAEERRRIVDDYLEAVFGDAESAVAERIRIGAPELPDDPSADQVAAWVELAELLRDPDYIATSRRMAERALADGALPDPDQFELGKAVGEHAGAAIRAGIAPDAPEAQEVVERLEAMAPSEPPDRLAAADRIEAFSDRRVAALLGAGGDRQRVAGPSDSGVRGAVRRLGVVRPRAQGARVAGRVRPLRRDDDMSTMLTRTAARLRRRSHRRCARAEWRNASRILVHGPFAPRRNQGARRVPRARMSTQLTSPRTFPASLLIFRCPTTKMTQRRVQAGDRSCATAPDAGDLSGDIELDSVRRRRIKRGVAARRLRPGCKPGRLRRQLRVLDPAVPSPAPGEKHVRRACSTRPLWP